MELWVFVLLNLLSAEKKKSETRDVGIQSTPCDTSSESSYSPSRSRKESEGDSSVSSGKQNPKAEVIIYYSLKFAFKSFLVMAKYNVATD